MKRMDNKTKRYVIHDTLEAYLVSEDKAYFFGLTTEGNITRNITQEEIKGGIYNKTIAILQTNDGMSFSVDTAIHYEDVMELQMGSKFEEGSTEIHKITEEADGSFKAEETTVVGDIMELDADKMPESYEVQLRTIAYDPATNKEIADVYWKFYQATPDGNLNEVFSAATNKTQTVTFTPQVPHGKNSYGQYVVVERKDEETEEIGG